MSNSIFRKDGTAQGVAKPAALFKIASIRKLYDAVAVTKPANFEPGEDYEYSSTNYLLINEAAKVVQPRQT